ncbi:methyl-accepting chemotaxis protein [Alkalispirochaeta americana]|uniref:Methyl-accepting chemotaxis protein n=1 Tax=Alkalispirochaeta americana TaxID=159291 RepID=A0A1N6TJL5_9SPIO|nr:bacteriohemerythrin [Alkalispirochaeta americana]SIQ53579.1 methyl-accepting chemotaxis protein [Alkalispirochaeta americana]
MKSNAGNGAVRAAGRLHMAGSAAVLVLLLLVLLSDLSGAGLFLRRSVFPLGVIVLGGWAFRFRQLMVSLGQAVDQGGQGELADVVSRVAESALASEGAGRKLAFQVGDTLAATARISSRSSDGKARVLRLSRQVEEGAAAVEEIQASVESLARRIGDQRAAVEQSVSAVTEMSSSIESVAQVAEKKREAADQLLDTTEEGRRAVTTTGTIIGEVVERVGAVHQMIDVINDIAARTNLLAMNAAIEAAHAGSSGRGFAVVAAEIRKLAEGTAANARHISDNLATLGKKIEDAQSAGTAIDSSFGRIDSEAREVSLAFREIGAATAELSTGTREVISAAESLQTISREISSSAEEMRVGAREVTRVITDTRSAAQDTVVMINEVGEASTDVTESTERISALSMDNNSQIDNLIQVLQGYQTGADQVEAEARKRLQMASIMLKHMSWVARVRMVLDGRISIAPEELRDHTACELGKWLARDGKTAITSPKTFQRLDETHRRLHGLVAELVRPDDSLDPSEREASFQELLAASHVITEILTSTYTSSAVEWTPAVAVQVQTFDNHHKKLFSLINKLYKALQDGAGETVLRAVFDELIEYAGYHFSAEEAALEHFAYPQCAKHKEEHALLVSRVKELRADLEKGKPLVAVEVMEFLRDWITNHIKKCDKLYSAFLADKDVVGFLRDSGREK